MMGMQGGTGLRSLQAKCPRYPKAVAVADAGHLLVVPSQSGFVGIVAHPSTRRQTEARYRISFGRSRQKRGPPAFFL